MYPNMSIYLTLCYEGPAKVPLGIGTPNNESPTFQIPVCISQPYEPEGDPECLETPVDQLEHGLVKPFLLTLSLLARVSHQSVHNIFQASMPILWFRSHK